MHLETAAPQNGLGRRPGGKRHRTTDVTSTSNTPGTSPNPPWQWLGRIGMDNSSLEPLRRAAAAPRLDDRPAPPLVMQAYAGRHVLDEGREAHAGEGPHGAGPDEVVPVQGLDQLAEEERVAVVAGAGGGVGGELVEGLVERREGLVDEVLSLRVDVPCCV